MRIAAVIFSFCFFATSCSGQQVKGQDYMKTIEFPSKDGLTITADWYETNPENSWILLCHQAGFSRGEYRETAPIFNQKGFNCMAIDQRSGEGVNGVKNETFALAKQKSFATKYADAEQDILAAIDYLYEKNGGNPIVIIGSSYSASLVLKIGATNEKVAKVLAFSPGEYIKGEKIGDYAGQLKKPVFVTSSKEETPSVADLMQNTSADYLVHYQPEKKSVHGSRALWEEYGGYKACWDAVEAFLK